MKLAQIMFMETPKDPDELRRTVKAIAAELSAPDPDELRYFLVATAREYEGKLRQLLVEYPEDAGS